MKSNSIGDGKVEHVVILIHGIRDLGAWHQPVQDVIGSDTVRIVAPKYGWFPPLRFLAPWDTSKRPMERVYRQLLNARRAFPNAKISVIAHSFGTHLFTKILRKYPDIRIHRVILCGAVIKQDFEWERVVEQIGEGGESDKAKFIVNDCGNRDIWPVLGASAGWRFGNAGTDGVGSVYVRDRFHDGGHGLFFDKDFIAEYWKPFITEGQFKDGDARQGDGVPGWLRFIARLPLRYLQIVIPILVLAIAVKLSMSGKPPLVADGYKDFDEFAAQLINHKDEGTLSAFRDNFEENKRFENWEACIVRVFPGQKRYQIWKDDQPTRTKIYADFRPNGSFNKSLKAGTWIKFEGIIASISVGAFKGNTVLSQCRLLDHWTKQPMPMVGVDGVHSRAAP